MQCAKFWCFALLSDIIFEQDELLWVNLRLKYCPLEVRNCFKKGEKISKNYEKEKCLSWWFLLSITLIISHLLPVRNLELDLSNQMQTLTATDIHASTATEQMFWSKIQSIYAITVTITLHWEKVFSMTGHLHLPWCSHLHQECLKAGEMNKQEWYIKNAKKICKLLLCSTGLIQWQPTKWHQNV